MQGGYVFYNDGDGGGLVCAKSDQTSPKWSNVISTSIGTTGTAIGTGLANSNAIVGQTGHTVSAANECLVYTDGTYSDWFLPSKDELNLMHLKLKLNGYGTFTEYYYWSSSEAGSSSAWIQYFDDGGLQNSNGKFSTSLYTRAVRAFSIVCIVIYLK